jgi:hypothetical protein
MSPTWVAKAVVALAQRDVRNIIVTINPLTSTIKEMAQSLYFPSDREKKPVNARR